VSPFYRLAARRPIGRRPMQIQHGSFNMAAALTAAIAKYAGA
jgi:hypothetical protein